MEQIPFTYDLNGSVRVTNGSYVRCHAPTNDVRQIASPRQFSSHIKNLLGAAFVPPELSIKRKVLLCCKKIHHFITDSEYVQ